jgi:hypothetical protein
MDGMIETFHVRFVEYEEYDVWEDEPVITLMATTPEGSYSARVPGSGPASKLRTRREAFKDYVLGCMAQHMPPHEVTIG